MTIFTAKWVYEKDGIQHERLLETDQVHVAYDQRISDAKVLMQKLGIYIVPPHGLVVLGNCYEGADSMSLTFGIVYIMNRDGKTVAKYHLAPIPPWEEAAGTGDEAPKDGDERSRQEECKTA